MKKKIFLMLFWVSTYLTFSQSIIITSPTREEKLYKGDRYTIRWNKNGVMNERVKIRLMQRNNTIVRITNSAQNNGIFIWQIPTDIPADEYKIRVKTIDNRVYDDSENFIISEPSIRITNPHRNLIWHPGKQYTIKWVKNGRMNEFVKIRLLQNRRRVLGIIDNTENDGEYSWRIPNDLPQGDTYNIRIKTLDNRVYDDSENFRIERERRIPLRKKLTVKFPNGGEKFFIGGRLEIKWDTGNIPGNVSLELYKGEEYYGAFYPVAPNIGTVKLYWVINVVKNGKKVGIQRGNDYRIKIKSLLYPNLYDFSDDNFSFEFPVHFYYPPPNRVITVFTGDEITFRWKILEDEIANHVDLIRFAVGKEDQHIFVSPEQNLVTRTRFSKNTTSYKWKIPLTVKEGYYRAYIAYGGLNILGESNKFYIKRKLKR